MPEPLDLSHVDLILKRRQSHEGALITMLQEVQQVYGHLPEEALVRLSRGSKIPLSSIYGVITFYAQFYLTPRGRNIVQICRGTPCHVRGSALILKMLTDTLGIDEGETTEDMHFSLETVACLGTCFLAPVMMVNRSYYGKMDPQKARALADSLAER